MWKLVIEYNDGRVLNLVREKLVELNGLDDMILGAESQKDDLIKSVVIEWVSVRES